MYAISQVNEGKYRLLSDALLQAFKPAAAPPKDPARRPRRAARRARIGGRGADGQARRGHGSDRARLDQRPRSAGQGWAGAGDRERARDRCGDQLQCAVQLRARPSWSRWRCRALESIARCWRRCPTTSRWKGTPTTRPSPLRAFRPTGSCPPRAPAGSCACSTTTPWPRCGWWLRLRGHAQHLPQHHARGARAESAHYGDDSAEEAAQRRVGPAAVLSAVTEEVATGAARADSVPALMPSPSSRWPAGICACPSGP